MKAIRVLYLLPFLAMGCGGNSDQDGAQTKADTLGTDSFKWEVDQFADVRVLRYKVPGWEQLSLQQKKLAYYLTMAGLSGRDMMWDQNFAHNLEVRKALEKILRDYKGERKGADWDHFLVYAKQIFFANGIHHHYGMEKFMPEFQRAYLDSLVAASGASLSKETADILFDPAADAKKVSLDKDKDLVLASAVNFYGDDINAKEVEAYYASKENKNDPMPLSWGINSKLVRGPDGKLMERTWKVGGMYGPALAEVVKWLGKAQEVAENPQQAKAIGLLIQYYNTGELKTWDEFNVAWVQDTTSTVDFINGFVEVYNDPLGRRGSYESCVEVIDPAATRNMRVIQEHAQWFEDNSPLLPEHKKKSVVGITYRFINTCGEAGDAAPSTPIGVNLPNADWIRKDHGSKSVSLGNIIDAYDQSSGQSTLKEFCFDQAEVDRAVKHGALAGKVHTALHEVIGHASGQIEPGVAGPEVTLKSYASTMEEGRADLVALYYMMDPKLVEWGVMPSLDAGKAEYDGYIRNGLMTQLRRLKPGSQVEEAHMRNRQWVSAWVFEKGQPDSVIQKTVRDGKTYFHVRDYEKLRGLFGELLRETQRIKSQGDQQAAHDLVENYGVNVDPVLHAEVLKRSEQIKTAPYAGFIQPRLVPVTDASGAITDVKIEYPDDFIGQMLEYGEQFGFLPVAN
jgi:dipeptidyl-peptidase-3